MAPTHASIMWMDGSLLPWSEGTTHVMSHVLHYGSGVFEGIKCYHTPDGPAIFRLEDHMQRMADSADSYGMQVPYTVDELVNASVEVVKANKLESGYIRPIVFYGYDSLGVHPNNCPIRVAIACFDWGAYLGDEGITKGVRITVSPWKKFHWSSFPTTAKGSGQYLNSLLAVIEARKRGFDEALLLNSEGNIAEGSGQNLFIVKDGRLYTNNKEASILMGITRDTIIKLSEDLDIPLEITDLIPDQLLTADEAFFTGTATEVTPIRELDGHTIGDGKPGEITLWLRAVYLDIVQGKRPEYQHWLTYV
ncbi:MAG: branched-chain amino acid transaminase [Fidelibacterota bacterium]|nr:MAG: branched-chain amino acid transaminase [Candidatus Neomarinimicrobiota bacterium]